VLVINYMKKRKTSYRRERIKYFAEMHRREPRGVRYRPKRIVTHENLFYVLLRLITVTTLSRLPILFLFVARRRADFFRAFHRDVG